MSAEGAVQINNFKLHIPNFRWVFSRIWDLKSGIVPCAALSALIDLPSCFSRPNGRAYVFVGPSDLYALHLGSALSF
jgi:hypothetical protein